MPREYDLYLPISCNNGKPVDPLVMERIKQELARAFGGYTHFNHRNEGAWRVGKVTFRDEVTIVRVLETEPSKFDMPAFKKKLEAVLQQETVLIVARDVQVL
jgi:hypothetical protein